MTLFCYQLVFVVRFSITVSDLDEYFEELASETITDPFVIVCDVLRVVTVALCFWSPSYILRAARKTGEEKVKEVNMIKQAYQHSCLVWGMLVPFPSLRNLWIVLISMAYAIHTCLRWIGLGGLGTMFMGGMFNIALILTVFYVRNSTVEKTKNFHFIYPLVVLV